MGICLPSWRLPSLTEDDKIGKGEGARCKTSERFCILVIIGLLQKPSIWTAAENWKLHGSMHSHPFIYITCLTLVAQVESHAMTARLLKKWSVYQSHTEGLFLSTWSNTGTGIGRTPLKIRAKKSMEIQKKVLIYSLLVSCLVCRG